MLKMYQLADTADRGGFSPLPWAAREHGERTEDVLYTDRSGYSESALNLGETINVFSGSTVTFSGFNMRTCQVQFNVDLTGRGDWTGTAIVLRKLTDRYLLPDVVSFDDICEGLPVEVRSFTVDTYDIWENGVVRLNLSGDGWFLTVTTHGHVRVVYEAADLDDALDHIMKNYAKEEDGE